MMCRAPYQTFNLLDGSIYEKAKEHGTFVRLLLMKKSEKWKSFSIELKVSCLVRLFFLKKEAEKLISFPQYHGKSISNWGGSDLVFCGKQRILTLELVFYNAPQTCHKEFFP